MGPNQAHAPGGGVARLFEIARHWPAASDARRWARQGMPEVPIHARSSGRRRWLSVAGHGPGEFWQRNGGRGMEPRKVHSFASIPLPLPRSARWGAGSLIWSVPRKFVSTSALTAWAGRCKVAGR
jgi:hypothetical protein